MNRCLINCFLILMICISGVFYDAVPPAQGAEDDFQINTPGKAAEFASKLANEKAQSAFGISPFTPESYSAQLVGSRWYWGKIEPPGIRGYSAEVQFNTDGSDRKVRAVLHTDKAFIKERYPKGISMEVIEQTPLAPEDKDETKP